MKILSIRGENLASLHGPFSVSLEDGPLARAGLFAITGPTGAGKSTLLDALCLALYGTTPRLEGNGGPKIGREDEDRKVGANDPRLLLRKGAGSGFAEVDFVGRDGRRYRARWSVRRAREKANGNLQLAEQQLRDVAEERAIGGTKTETLAAIEERVGLSYEQFRRSVLLAQGDFAAFLRARGRERAELLERVTGSELYRLISMKAYAKAREVEKELRELELRQEQRPVLAPEARAELEARAEEAKRRHEEAREALAALEKAAAWHRTLREKAREETEAAARLAEAEAAREAAEPDRAWLRACEKAAGVRHLIEAADAAAERRATTERELAEAREARAAEASRIEEGARVLAGAREAKAAFEREVAAALPAIEAARKLDGAIEAAAAEAEKARAASETAASILEERRGAAGALRDRHAAASAALARADEELAGQGALLPLLEEWPRWKAELERLAGAVAAQAAARAREASLAERLRTANLARASAGEALRVAEGGRAEAEARLVAARAARETLPGAELRERRVALARGLEELAERRAIAESARELASAAERARAEAEAARAAEAAARGAEGEASAAIAAAEAAVGAERGALDAARKAAGYEAARAELRDGEACPLCGSLDHPWAHEDRRVDAVIASLGERLVAAEERLRGLVRARADAAAQAASSARAHARWAEEAAALEARLAGQRAKWREAGAGAPEDPAAHAVAAWLGERAAELRDEQAAIAKVDSALAEAERELHAAQQASDGARTACDRARTALHEAETAASSLAAAHEEAAATRARHDGDRAALAASLVRPLASWPDAAARLEREPAALLEELASAIASRRRAEGERERARAELAKLEPELAEARAKQDGAEAAARSAAGERNERAAALEALRRERGALLGGRAVAEVEQRERAARRAHDERVDALATALAKADAAHASHEGRCVALEKRAAACVQEREAAAARRDEALAAAGLALETARELLAFPEEVRRARAERVAACDLAVQERKSHRALVEQQRRAHEAAGAPSLDEPAVAAELPLAAERVARLEHAFHDERAKLQADDAARASHAELLPRLEALRRRQELWGSLDRLIGSAAGDKFQVFAQSLTLDVLLAHANEHLRELAPRYALQRVPGEELELQVVDHDMGDEIRGTGSLSGGESFLVSLALALGLSGLSSSLAPVESLFIDEGFGTLDPQTLDVALATLDALQAGGRKVGIISHVTGLADRIGAQVLVVPRGAGRSAVEVRAR